MMIQVFATAIQAPDMAGAANVDAKVGPNAVTQVAAALRARGGDALASRVFGAAGLADLLVAPPDHMIDQQIAARLHNTLSQTLPPADAKGIAADAGRRTADYLLAHRIPHAAQWLMKRLPSRLAARVLLKAVAANAWTFAGTGQVRIIRNDGLALEIIRNPLAQPHCPWHVAVFERLFRALVAPDAQVTHAACCAAGATTCRFDITF